MSSSVFQRSQTLSTSWQPTPQPQHLSPPRGRTGSCRSSQNPRGRKPGRKRAAKLQQPLPTTTAPRTEPERGGSANRSAASSLPRPDLNPDPPQLSCTHWASTLTFLHPTGYHLNSRCQKEKRRGNDNRTTECAKPPPLTPPPHKLLLFLFLFKTTKCDAKTRDQNGTERRAADCQTLTSVTQMARRSTARKRNPDLTKIKKDFGQARSPELRQRR